MPPLGMSIESIISNRRIHDDSEFPMKITDIKVFPTQVGNHSQFLVKVERDEGIFGRGEGGLANHEHAVRGVIDYFKGFLIGSCSRSCLS
jgi:L-alanine-DL-glutamate epimerase-like enolase superfamily enzyme